MNPYAGLRLALLVGIVGGLSACNGDGDGATGPGNSVSSIAVSPDGARFGAVGSTVPFEAVAQDAAGEAVPGVEIQWSTAGSGVILVDPETGLVEALGNGTERLIASADDVTAEVTVTVSQVPVALMHPVSTIRIDRVGALSTLSPAVSDSNGVSLTTPGSFEYASADPLTASVDPDGVIRANWFGSTTMTIMAGNLTTSVDVDVVAPGALQPVLGTVEPCAGGTSAGFRCEGIDLAAFVPLAGLGAPPGIGVNDVWGWRDSVTFREYALVGRDDGVAFVDVTSPGEPRTIGFLPGASSPTAYRALNVHRNHLYVVADSAAGHGIQILDLTNLRGIENYTQLAASFRYDVIDQFTAVAVNDATGFGYAVGARFGDLSCGGGLHALDLTDPLRPAFAGCFNDDRTGLAGTGLTHDAHCVVYTGPDADHAGREICFGANETALSIADVTDPAAPVALSFATYSAAYAHQGWLTEDQRYFLMADSRDEIDDPLNSLPTRTLVWDVQDLDVPVLAGAHFGPTRATDREILVLGDRAYLANQEAGLRVLDVTDPVNPVDLGRFDTYANGDDPSGLGAWATYPFFDDGRVLVTSREEGLFVLVPQS